MKKVKERDVIDQIPRILQKNTAEEIDDQIPIPIKEVFVILEKFNHKDYNASMNTLHKRHRCNWQHIRHQQQE